MAGDQFGIFYTSKPQGCRADADCSNGLVCDAGLGFVGERYDNDKGQTVRLRRWHSRMQRRHDADVRRCSRSQAAASARIRPAPPGPTLTWDGSAASALKNLVGVRSASDPRRYLNTREWLTNKFSNVTPRTVRDFVPARGAGAAHQDYRIATGAGRNQRVFLWGRPGFIGVSARGRPLGLYFAYADMPTGVRHRRGPALLHGYRREGHCRNSAATNGPRSPWTSTPRAKALNPTKLTTSSIRLASPGWNR